jgi:hypothetical protein
MAPENWHIRIEDSEITFFDKLLTGPDIESKVELDVKNFLSSLGIKTKTNTLHIESGSLKLGSDSIII